MNREMPSGGDEKKTEETHDGKVNRIVQKGVEKLKHSLIKDLWVERFRSWSMGGSKDDDIRKSGGFDGWTNDDFKKYLKAIETME